MNDSYEYAMLAARFAAVTAERDKLATDLTAARGERDEWQAQCWTAQRERDEARTRLLAAQAVGDTLEDNLTAAREVITSTCDALDKIVISDGQDAGVILLSDDSPTHYDPSVNCQVYDHENFSPLGDALVTLARSTAIAAEIERLERVASPTLF